MGSIVEVCGYYGPYPGSFIPSLLAVGREVRARLDLDYHAVFPKAVRDRSWTQLMRAEGIEPVFLPSGAGRAQCLRDLTALARRTDARLLRSHYTRWDLETAVAARRAGAHAIWHVRTGNLHYTVRHRATDLVKVRLFGRLCARVIGVSEAIGRELRMRGFPPDKVTVVLNGIDLSRFDRAPDRAAARAALGVPDDARVMLAFCWDPFNKGADLIAAAAELAGERLVVLLVGGEDLRTYLGRHLGGPPPPWLRVVPPRDDSTTLYAAADVFVSASRQDAFSYAIGEAMASRLPIVSSDIPGPAAYFHAAGLETFRSGDAADLAAAMRRVLAAGDRAALGEANRAYVRDRLSLERHVEAVLDVFERTLAQPAETPRP